MTACWFSAAAHFPTCFTIRRKKCYYCSCFYCFDYPLIWNRHGLNIFYGLHFRVFFNKVFGFWLYLLFLKLYWNIICRRSRILLDAFLRVWRIYRNADLLVGFEQLLSLRVFAEFQQYLFGDNMVCAKVEVLAIHFYSPIVLNLYKFSFASKYVPLNISLFLEMLIICLAYALC